LTFKPCPAVLLFVFVTGCAPLESAPVARIPEASGKETPSSATPSSAPPPAPIDFAPPHPALAKILPLFQQAAGDAAPTAGQVDEATCLRLTGLSVKNFDRCTLELLANGTAPAVGVTYECGGDSCSAEVFVWYGDEAAPYVVHGGFTPLEVSPDHRYLLLGELLHEDESFVPNGVRTVRFDRKARKAEPFLDCLSARLSPGGRWYLCRDLSANVFKVPVSGGKLQMIVHAELPKGETIKVGGPFEDYPEAVTFPNDHELEYELFLNGSGEVLKRRAPWRETPQR
jgi:hypothetical protein